MRKEYFLQKYLMILIAFYFYSYPRICFFFKKIRIIEREVAILCNLVVKVTFTLLPILWKQVAGSTCAHTHWEEIAWSVNTRGLGSLGFMSKPPTTPIEFLSTSSHVPISGHPSCPILSTSSPLPASPVLFSPPHMRYVSPLHSLCSCPFLHVHSCVCFLVLTAFLFVSVPWELQNNSLSVTSSLEHPQET